MQTSTPPSKEKDCRSTVGGAFNSRMHYTGLTLSSLTGMLNTTKTGLGKALLKRWLLQPSTEAEVLTNRLNAVECFSRSENSTSLVSLSG